MSKDDVGEQEAAALDHPLLLETEGVHDNLARTPLEEKALGPNAAYDPMLAATTEILADLVARLSATIINSVITPDANGPAGQFRDLLAARSDLGRAEIGQRTCVGLAVVNGDLTFEVDYFRECERTSHGYRVHATQVIE